MSSSSTTMSGGSAASTSALETPTDLADETVDRHAHLLERVAVADRDGAVVERVEVDGDAPRRADLVLTAVAPADRLRLVVIAHEVRLQPAEHLAGERRERLLLGEREHRHLVRREARVQ